MSPGFDGGMRSPGLPEVCDYMSLITEDEER